MRNTLICTVGTSLFGNINRLDSADLMKQAVADENWIALSQLLVKEDNLRTLCGAEINSITRICQQGYLDEQKRLIFLVSDTLNGKNIGIILQKYYSHSSNPLQFEQVENRTLEGLRDDDVQQFKREGLKNLVLEISKEVDKHTSEAVAINATGGYKAQISFAGMIGQALNIPVYYQFEAFSEVIELPPQPVSLDLSLWLNHYDMFVELEDSQQVEKSQIEHDLQDESLQSMLEEVEMDGVLYIALSAMGQLFHDRCRLQFPLQETTLLSLVPETDLAPENKPIRLRDDHGLDVLKAFAKRMCQSPYITKIVNSLPFNPHRTAPIRRISGNGQIEFVLCWTDRGLGLCIQTTGRNKAETTAIALHLAQEFGRG
jgi:putative CRISPR-associated protein (TIGR02619 family)